MFLHELLLSFVTHYPIYLNPKSTSMNVYLLTTYIKPYTPSELADVYGVSRKTLNTWLKPHREAVGKRESIYYTALQVKIIFEKLGLPAKIDEAA